MLKIISILKKLHSLYQNSKYLQGIFGFLLLIINKKYLKIKYSIKGGIK